MQKCCLSRYERVDELIWVKTNQLQRIIRTGRTGHWLNHGKEHCLVSNSCIYLFSITCVISSVFTDVFVCLYVGSMTRTVGGEGEFFMKCAE